jgi:hypothetical protein
MARPPLRERILRWSVFGALALVAALLVTHLPDRLLASRFGGEEDGSAPRGGTPLASAFGASGEVRLQLRLPGELFEFPVDVAPAVAGAAPGVSFSWVRAEDSATVEQSRVLARRHRCRADGRAGQPGDEATPQRACAPHVRSPL